LDVVPDPSDPTTVYFTNFFTNGPAPAQKGVYKMQNNEFVKVYNFNNGSAYYYRPVGLTFDEQNNLFCSVQCTIPSLSGNCSVSSFYLFNKAADAFGADPFTTFNIGGVQKPLTKMVLYIFLHLSFGWRTLMYDYNNTAASTSDDKFKVLKTSG
jgi:hypothetical protein